MDTKNLEVKTQTLFGRWSKYYDNRLNRLVFFEPTYRQIIRLLKNRDGERLAPSAQFLDIACGTGEIIARLATDFPSVKFVGVDFTAAMLQKAKEKTIALKNVQWQEADVAKLPFEDNVFDIILCSDAFHHFFNPKQVLSEICRVLKTGGLFLLVDPAINNPILHFFANTVLKKFENAEHYYSQSELEKLLVAKGFAVDMISKHYFNNYFICFKK